MGLFDWLKKKSNDENKIMPYAPTMSGYTPVFSSFGDNIYASDIIVQATSRIANEMMKLRPRHIRTTNGKQEVITDSSVARVLRRPNEFMTTADYLSKITILNELTDNTFIYPDYYISKGNEKIYTGLYPLKPMNVEYLTEVKTNRLYIRLTFGNGAVVTLPSNEVIHWRKNYGVDDYFGGNMFGTNQNRELLKNLQAFNTIKQAVSEAMKCSLSITGVMKYISLMNEDKLKAERDKFVESLRKGESNVMFLDGKAEYQTVSRDIKLVDKDTLEFFYENILRSSGVSIAILNGDYTPEQKSAFYESVLEPRIISLGQAKSKVLFNDRAAAFGNEVILYPDEIQNMSIDKRIAWLNIAVPAGAVSKNEIRSTVGLPPIEGGDEYPRGYNSVDSGIMGNATNTDADATSEGDNND